MFFSLALSSFYSLSEINKKSLRTHISLIMQVASISIYPIRSKNRCIEHTFINLF